MLCDCLFVFLFRRSGRYNSCGDNHSIKPPNPEQYLTPLQQKEVTVRHLKTKLKESESKLKERYISLQKSELKIYSGAFRGGNSEWFYSFLHLINCSLRNLKYSQSD